MPIELSRVAMIVVAAAEQRGVAGEAAAGDDADHRHLAASRAKLAKVATCRPATMGMSTSPGRPPPPSANSTTGSRCVERDAEHAVGLLVVAHALRAGEHGRVVGHDDGARRARRRTARALTLPMPVTMPSAGVLRIRSSSARRLRCAAKASAPYSTKLPASQRSAMFSRAVRRPARRRATASGRLRRRKARRAQLEQVGAQCDAGSAGAACAPARAGGGDGGRLRAASPR